MKRARSLAEGNLLACPAPLVTSRVQFDRPFDLFAGALLSAAEISHLCLQDCSIQYAESNDN